MGDAQLSGVPSLAQAGERGPAWSLSRCLSVPLVHTELWGAGSAHSQASSPPISNVKGKFNIFSSPREREERGALGMAIRRPLRDVWCGEERAEGVWDRGSLLSRKSIVRNRLRPIKTRDPGRPSAEGALIRPEVNASPRRTAERPRPGPRR